MSAEANSLNPQTYGQMKLEEFRQKQGLKPLDGLETLFESGIWPEEDNIDEFLSWLQKSRHGQE